MSEPVLEGNAAKLAALKAALAKPKAGEPTEEEILQAEMAIDEEGKELEEKALEVGAAVASDPPITAVSPDRMFACKELIEEDKEVERAEELFKRAALGRVGFIQVHRTWKDGKIVKKDEIVEEDKIDVRLFHAPTATVGHMASMSISMGDYENCKVQVMCSLPCYIEELDEAYRAAQQFVDMRLNKQVQAVKEVRNKRRRELGE